MKHKSDYTFSQVPVATIPRSVFNRNHQYKTTFNAGELIPFYVDEVLPGDTFRANLSVFCRLATPIVALMDNLHLDIHFFFVPNRLVWSNWAKFCGEKDNPGDSTTYVIPQVTGAVVVAGSLYDYMGIPLHASGQAFNALPFRAYNLVYNEWYRDQNLCNSATVPKGDGPDNSGLYVKMNRAKRYDYFTGCLPWPQKGPGVMLPLGTTAPVTISPLTSHAIPTFWNATTGTDAGRLQRSGASALQPVNIEKASSGGSANEGLGWNNPNLGGLADLAQATAGTINSLRQAFQVQHLLERDARGGTRYIELLKSHFGVVSPDFRVQRPEYLGGGSLPIMVNPVIQNSGVNKAEAGYVPTPTGYVAGYGVGAAHRMGFSKSFVEHGYVLGIVSGRADLTYQQGIHRMWTRSTKFDFYWPALAHLGEQAVLNKELYFQNNPTYDDAVFGYQERWAEYRYKPSQVTGLFRSGASGTLDFWHLAQKFTALPQLGATFIEEAPPMGRIKAVQAAPDFLFDSYMEVRCARPMPLYSVPGLIDHF